MFGSLSLTASTSRLDGQSNDDSEAASITTMLENLSLEEPEFDEGLFTDKEIMTDSYSEDGTEDYPGSSASSWRSSEGHESFIDCPSDEPPEFCGDPDPGAVVQSSYPVC